MLHEQSPRREVGGDEGRGGASPAPMGPLSLAAIVAFGTGLGAFAWLMGVDTGRAANPTRLESFAAEMRAEGPAAAERTDAWMEEARRALVSPIRVTVPFRESRRFESELLAAVGYAFRLREGQVLEAKVIGDPGRRHFLELYRLPDPVTGADGAVTGVSSMQAEDAQPTLVAEADSTGVVLDHESRSGGDYVLRVLPEPFGGGRFSVEISVRAAFGFPVADRGPGSVISPFGAPRDEGVREHEGVDVYAPRGTPVVAVTRAMVSEVGTSGRGGNYVWLQDWSRDKEIYYAHLDSTWVSVGMVLEPGDPLGAVGNTGNAETTVPHLHFGIYDLDRRATDPLPYIVPVTADRMAASDTAP